MQKQQLKTRFVARISDLTAITALFDTLPDVAFYALDLKGRIMMFNRRSCELFGFRNEGEALGKTNFDLFPKALALYYSESDSEVMRTGKTISNAIMISPAETQQLIVYSKIPLRDKNQEIIGLVGLHRFISAVSATPDLYGHFTNAVNHIHKHYAEKLTLSALARLARLSESQVERKFMKLFGFTPMEYILRTRVNAARVLLENSNLTISNIAVETGFSDHSHLIRLFKRVRGCTPHQYRQQHFAKKP